MENRLLSPDMVRDREGARHVMIQIVDHPGWTEARCRCGMEAVVLNGPAITADETRAGIELLIEHARRCAAAADEYRILDPTTAKLYERLLFERYPTRRD